MTLLRSISPLLVLSLWLAATGMASAKEAAKAPVAGEGAAKKAAPPSLQWPAVSEPVKIRARKLSPDAQKKLQAAIQENDARLQKAFEGIVREDEAAKLSQGGVPAPFSRFAASAGPERRGPPPEVVERYSKLSEDAKDKLRKRFAEHKERTMNMNPEERRAFMESTFREIAKEDEAKKSGVSAKESSSGKSEVADKNAQDAKKTADHERFSKLSDAAREQLRKQFADNKDRLRNMSSEERKEFMQKALKTAEEEGAKRKPVPGTPADAPAADGSAKTPPSSDSTKRD